MKRRRGLGNTSDRAARFFNSANENMERICKRHAKANPCSLITHYTDVAVEASIGATLAEHNGNETVRREADRLAGKAARAQQGAVKACSMGIRKPRD